MGGADSLGSERKKTELQIADLAKLCDKHCKPYFTWFLNEEQASLALDILTEYSIENYKLWGGFEGAERSVLCIYPPYCCPENDEFPIECISFAYRNGDKLTHRDFLGALMSLGIKREAVGDIVAGQGITSLFVKRELADYVRTQITKVGRVGVKLTERHIDFTAVSKAFEVRECTVSSLRLDSIVNAALKLGRGKAQQLIESGLAAKNSRIVYDCDCRVEDGDKLSVRGFGKFIVNVSGEMSKKGKYRIVVNRLV